VESTVENGFGRNHSLCHGDLGNLELVTVAAETLDRPDWAERAGRIAGGILAGLRERGPLFGLPGRTEPPGMMTGLAGIGYGLLRLAAPERVPSVLILEGPDRPWHHLRKPRPGCNPHAPSSSPSSY
jgi:lantibiotic modifying enzyme